MNHAVMQFFRFPQLFFIILFLYTIIVQSNDIVKENQLKGTNEWWYPQPTTFEAISIVKRLQGFTTQFSFIPTETVYFKVNSLYPSDVKYKLFIFRLGYYEGLGGRLVGEVQVDRSYQQPPCLYELSSRMVDCDNWSITVSWKIPSNLLSGVYVALPVAKTGEKGSYIPFVIRGSKSSSGQQKNDILFKTADSTWVAYNKYGSWNVYRGNGSFTFASRAFKASYNRPFANRLPKPNGQHENYIFGSEYAMLYWLEKHGYDVSYASSYDVERYVKDNALYSSYRLLLSVGHDEYWTEEMKNAYTNSRNRGIHLAFFSGNEAFWRIIWEYSRLKATSGVVQSTDGSLLIATSTEISTNIKNSISEPRIIVCKKESIDDIPPLPTISHWTGTFMDPRHRFAEPQNELTGQLFMVNGFRNDSIHVRRNDTKLRFWRQTLLQNMSSIIGNSLLKNELFNVNDGGFAGLSGGGGYWTPTGVLGYEWDIFSDDCYRPPGLFSLSWTSMRINNGLLEAYGANYKGSSTVSHHISIYRYISPDYRYDHTKVVKGYTSLVFGTGTIQWPWALSSHHDGNNMTVDYNLQQATINVFADMSIHPYSLRKEKFLHIASESSDMIPPVSIISQSTYPKKCSGMILVQGMAYDIGGGRIASVEVSFDNGTTWNIARGREKWSIKYNIFSNENKDCSKDNSAHHLKYEIGSAMRSMIFQTATNNNNNNNHNNGKAGKHKYNSQNHGIGGNIGNNGPNTGNYDLLIISRAVDDSGWIEGCCGYNHLSKITKLTPRGEKIKNVTNRIYLKFSCPGNNSKKQADL